ncbi:MAG: ComEC/Rec2 family competence protein, partial [Thermodesulfobacteriota bacterium]
MAFLISGILLSNSVNISKTAVVSAAFFITVLSLIKRDFLLFLFIPLSIFLNSQTSKVAELPNRFLDTKIDVTGNIYKNPEKRQSSWRLFINVKKVETGRDIFETDINIVVYSKELPVNTYYGSIINIKNLRLETIHEFKNPGSFSLKNHFKRMGILYSAFINNPKNIAILGLSRDSNYPLYQINKFRRNYEDFVRRTLNEPESEIINAITIGASGGVSEKIRNDFSKLGISHLLAISGLHIGALSFFIFFVTKWILKRSRYLLLMYEVPKIASIITIFPIIIYAALAGFATPVVRALIMITVYFLTVFFGREESKINILALAAILILLADPMSLFNLSFRLSFIAVGGIIIFHQLFPFELNTFANKLSSMIKTTVAATFFTLPIVINSFGYLPVSTVPANFFAVPLVELFVVPAGLLSIIFYPVSKSICELILIFNAKILSIIIYFADLLLSADYSYFTVPDINKRGYLFFVLTFVLMAANRFSKKMKYLAILAFLGFTILLFINNDRKYNAHTFEINFLDAGTKSYSLINLPNNKKILVSGGYSYYSKSDFTENAGVIPFLLERGITKLDYLWFLSTDNSHLEGAAAIAERIDLKNIWTNGSRLDGKLWKIIREKNIEWKNVQEELEVLYFGDIKISFIKPNVNNKIWNSKEPRPVVISIANQEHR